MKSFRHLLLPLLCLIQILPAAAQTAPGWDRTTVFYQVFVRSFADGNGDGTGDLRGLTDKLGYIKDLGAGAVWLMPIYPSPSYHGYDITDYRSIQPDLGTLADFDALIQKAHQLGLKVILDWVVNHTSSQHPWFVKALAGDPRYQNYYRWADKAENGSWGLQSNGRYAYFAFGPQSGMPDLNYENPQVHQEILDAARFWLAKGVDGFRLDVAQHIGDGKRELTLAWWKEFQTAVKATNPAAFIVGEVNYDGPTDYTKIAPYYSGMDSAFDFPAYNHLTVFASGLFNDIVTPINRARSAFKPYQADPMDSLTLGNHDRQRLASFLKFDSAKIFKALTVLFTLPGRPFLYYGDELGMRGGHDRQGDPYKREPFDWWAAAQGPGQTTMTKAIYTAEARNLRPNDGISVEEEAAAPTSTLNYTKALIKARLANPWLFDGQLVRLGGPQDIYAYQVVAKTGQANLTALFNQNTKTERSLQLTKGGIDLLTGQTYADGASVTLPVFGSLLIKREGQEAALSGFPITNPPLPPCTLTVRVHVPATTPADAVLWMPNSSDGWEPGTVTAKPALKLIKTGPGVYEITITQPGGSRLEYKFFRGSWETSETEADGNWNGNREFLFLEPATTVDATIDGWRDINYKGQ